MKKIIYFLLILSITVMPFSCTLEEESLTEISKENYVRNAAEAENILLGVYRGMIPDAMYAYHLSILFNITTDIAQTEGSTANGFRVIPTNAFTTSQKEVQDTWSALYKAIYNANNFMETLEAKVSDFPAGDKPLAKIYMAEARGLRGLFYFELVRRFGHIALMKNTAMSQQHPSTFVQADPREVYEFIEADLLFAAENLPYADEDRYRSNPSFRLSKGSALGLLAKVYATWAGHPVQDASKWEQAAKTAGLLIESNRHGLLADYEQLWRNAGAGLWDWQESLIEVSFYSPTTTGAAEDPCGRIGKWNGVSADAIAGARGRNAGNVKVIHAFVLDWRNYTADKRRDISIANYQYVGNNQQLYVRTASSTPEQDVANDADETKSQKSKQNYTPAKWDTEKYVPASNELMSNDKSNVNWYILRYSDVLLIYAEAVNEWKHGPTADAYAAVNMVRRRGYGEPISLTSAAADLPAGLSQADFRERVRKERAFELAFEGHRRLDLVRWGRYFDAIQETSRALSSWWEGGDAFNFPARQYTTERHNLFPIPQHEMDITNFTQNTGWY